MSKPLPEKIIITSCFRKWDCGTFTNERGYSMNSNRNTHSLIKPLILILVGFGILSFNPKVRRTVGSIFGKATKPSAPSGESPNGLIQAAPACSNKNSSQDVTVSIGSTDSQLEVIMHAGDGNVAEPADRCYEVGKEYPISINAELSPTAAIDMTVGAWVKVTKIRSITDQGRQSLILDLAHVRGLPRLVDRGPHIEASFGKIISESYPGGVFAAINTLIEHGGVLIDVRGTEDYLAGHDLRALSVPYQASIPTIRLKEISKPYSQFTKSDYFDLTKLPADKSKPLIFYGWDPIDYRPLRAMLAAHESGWKDVYWFREGEATRIGRRRLVREQLPDIKTVRLEETRELLKDKGIAVVSVLAPEDFKTAHIPGSVNAQFLYADPLAHFPEGNLGLNMEAFLLAKDSFQENMLPASKTTPILIYGIDHFDGKAAKAAIWAKARGWTTIYWYRDGLMDWMAAAAPVEGTTSAPH
jgi:rhodanese-related sulfurtransferase